MFSLSLKRFSKLQIQLIVQGLYLLIGFLLILVGAECLNIDKAPPKPSDSAPATTCSIR